MFAVGNSAFQYDGQGYCPRTGCFREEKVFVSAAGWAARTASAASIAKVAIDRRTRAFGDIRHDAAQISDIAAVSQPKRGNRKTIDGYRVSSQQTALGRRDFIDCDTGIGDGEFGAAVEVKITAAAAARTDAASAAAAIVRTAGVSKAVTACACAAVAASAATAASAAVAACAAAVCVSSAATAAVSNAAVHTRRASDA